MNEPEHKHESFDFFFDGRKIVNDQPSLTGAQIKAKGGATATYQLFLEEEGDQADRPISDSEGVHLGGKIKHFYAVPPATFGAK